MTELISLSIGLGVFYFMQFFLFELGKDGRNIEKRLRRLERLYEKKEDKSELDIPFIERVVRPLLAGGGRLIKRVTPKKMIRDIETNIARAGSPRGLTQSRWIFIRIMTGFILPVLSGVYLASVMNKRSDLLIAVAAIFVFANLVPRVLLERAAKERRVKIEHGMPDALDLISVCVEAGLSFDGALSKIVEKMDGPLSEDFKITLGEMKLGSTKKKALSNMAERCDVPELTSFLASVIQADELGVPITNVLRVQSVQLREKRKQKAQEKAMKAPVKILFPLVFFIFPSIFVIILGPSVIRLMDIFGR